MPDGFDVMIEQRELDVTDPRDMWYIQSNELSWNRKTVIPVHSRSGLATAKKYSFKVTYHGKFVKQYTVYCDIDCTFFPMRT